MKRRSRLLLVVLSAFLASVTLSACGNSEDGPMLSDEEKIKRMKSGHDATLNQPGAGGAPGTAATGTTGG